MPEYQGFWIYAHNGGNFDFLFLLRELIKKTWRYEIEITPIQSCMFMVVVTELEAPGGKQKRDAKWTFLDSARLMPLKLNQVGTTFGIGNKVELKMSYNDLAAPKNKAIMAKYLKQDCVLLHQSIVAFQKIINRLGGQLGATLPSTAIDVFRRKFLLKDIYTNRHFGGCPDYGKANRKSGKKNKSKQRGKSITQDHPIRNESRKHIHDPLVHRPILSGRGETINAGRIGTNGSGNTKRNHSNSIGRGKSNSEKTGNQGNVKLKKCTGCGHRWLREGYYGGRTEIFRMKYKPTKEHPIAYFYDINSHYPHCMLEAMPIGPAMVLKQNFKLKEIISNAKRMVGIVECTVEIPKNCYLPPLPYRNKGKLIFPTGRFRGHWDAVELAALPRVGGKIIKTHKSAWFDASPIFAPYIETLYKFRNKKAKNFNSGMSWIAKILMNSTYGKFAMKEDRTSIVVHPDELEGLTPIDLDSDVWTKETQLCANYVAPQLSIHVTALARIRLWEKMQDILDQGGRIYYCDTDSIVTSGVEIPTGAKLGQWELENKITRAEFVLPKLYLVETLEENEAKRKEKNLKIKAKGLGPGLPMGNLGDDLFAGQLSEKDFVRLCISQEPIKRHRLTKFKESLAAYSKEALSFPRVVATEKQLQSDYDKRVVLRGFNTRPLQISQV